MDARESAYWRRRWSREDAGKGAGPTTEGAPEVATSIPLGPKIKPNLQVCLEHCYKKVTACLEICNALPSSKDWKGLTQIYQMTSGSRAPLKAERVLQPLILAGSRPVTQRWTAR